MSDFVLKKFPEILKDIKPTEVSAKLNSLLSKYDGMVEFVPFSSILTTILFYQESVMSSRLEGTIATLTDLLDYKVGKDVSEKIKEDSVEIENYRDALGYMIDELQDRNYDISNSVIKNMHYKLMDKSRGDHKSKGKFTEKQNYIGNRFDKEITYTPVSYLHKQEYMENLVNFVNESTKDISPVVKIAIIHAYFELIHPFEDGNGRVGRILIPVLMKKYGVLTTPYFYISYYFAKNRSSYIDNLEKISKNNDWNSWINFFLEAMEKQTMMLIEMLRRLKDVRNETEEQILLLRSQFSIQLLNFLFKKIKFKTSDLIEKTNINPNTARALLKQMEERGIIEVEEKGSGRASSIYRFTKLYQMVEEIKA